MAEAVKTRMMKQLAENLGAIADLGSVHRWQGQVIDLETVKAPALYFWDMDEKRDRRNRLALGVVHVMVWVFIPLSPKGQAGFHDQADLLQGLIHNAVVDLSRLQELALGVEELKVDKEFPNDQWGILIMDFNLTYGHAYGNAFSTAY